MKNFLKNTVIIITVALICFSGTKAADTTSVPKICSIDISINTGLTIYLETFGISYGVDGTISTEENIFRLRYNHHELFYLFEDPETVSDLGFVYGACKQKGIWYFDAGAGLSAVYGIKHGELIGTDWFSKVYEPVRYIVPGIPFEITGMIKGEYGGLGIGLKGNLNPEKSYMGLFLTAKISIPTI